MTSPFEPRFKTGAYLHEPRDPHGHWVKGAGGSKSGGTSSTAVKPQDGEGARQEAAKRQLLAFAQLQIQTALNTPPEKMTPGQVEVATRVLANLSGVQITQAVGAARKVVSPATVEHVETKLNGLKDELDKEQAHDARVKLIRHVAVIFAAIGISLGAAGLPIPAFIAALIGAFPYLTQELGDFKTDAGSWLARHRKGYVPTVIKGVRSYGLRTAETPVVSTVHAPFGSPAGPGLFHVKGLQLPAYIQNVAHAFVRRGMTESEAIQRAVGVVRDWASGRTPNGRGRVHPDVQAAASKAIAEWEAAKAAAHAQSGRSYERGAGMEPAQFRAQMSTSDINNLPDDAFAYIEPGGTKDGSGKTVPREKRHFPVHDAAHVRDALGRAPQSPFGDKAMPKIKAAAAKLGVSVSDGGRSMLADEEMRELRLTSQYKGLDSRLEIRSDMDGQWVGGYASVFMPRESRNLGGFIERVSPDAFNEARAGGWSDVVCRFNHDSNYVLGTAAAGTLRLRTDNVGLDYQVLPPQAEDKIRELVARGDIRYSSFAFRCLPGGDEWGITDQNFPLRTLHGIELVDVAPVLTPAYKDATAAVRATAPALRSLAEHMQIAVDEVRALADADELRTLFVRTDKPIYRPEPKKLFGPAAAAMLLARRRDPYDQE